MLGFFAGIVLAIWYRKEGPQEPEYEWMEEEETGREGEEERERRGDRENK